VYDFRLTSLTPLAQLWSVKFYWTHSSVQFSSVHMGDLRESTTFCWLLSSVDPYMYIHIWLYPTDISVLFKQSESKRNALCKCGCHTTAGKKCIMMRVFILWWGNHVGHLSIWNMCVWVLWLSEMFCSSIGEYKRIHTMNMPCSPHVIANQMSRD